MLSPSRRGLKLFCMWISAVVAQCYYVVPFAKGTETLLLKTPAAVRFVVTMLSPSRRGLKRVQRWPTRGSLPRYYVVPFAKGTETSTVRDVNGVFNGLLCCPLREGD